MDDPTPGFQRILGVDDDPAIRHMVGERLERQGFEVLTAANGKEAPDVIHRHGLPHLAVVDLTMPERVCCQARSPAKR